MQTAGGNISRLVSGFPNFHFEEVDGTDPVASYAAFVRSVAHCRAGHGPAFVHAHVIRPYSHSLSDDERLYRPDVERQRDAQRDPITRMQMFLIREGILDEKGINRLEKQVDDDLQVAVDRALQAPPPTPDTVTAIHLFAESGSHVVRLRNPARAAQTRGRGSDGKKPAPKTMADLITATLRDEMRRDERIVIFGEDVADCSREEYLKQKLVKGKGGVFKLTAGLQMEFGSDRVFNSPIAEANIVGRATGMADARAEAGGRNPVLRLHLARHDATAQRAAADPLALLQHIFRALRDSRGHRRLPHRRRHLSLPVRRKRLYPHSRLAGGVSFERAGRRGPAAHRDPLRRPRAFPRTQAALSRNLRPRALPRSGLHGAVRQGQSGASREPISPSLLMERSSPGRLQAVQKLEREHGVKAELIDLRSLNPFDWETIAASVQKTNRALVAYEDTLSWGYGAEIAARIADQMFEHLDAPVRRVAAMDVYVAYHPDLENAILPQTATCSGP